MIGGMTDTSAINNFLTFVMSINSKHLPADMALFCNSAPVGRFGRTVC
jgi:hypothetical protein